MPVTHRDLARLVQSTGRPVEALVEWLSPDEIDMTGEPESFVLLDVGRRLLVLGHRDGGCELLNREGRCSEYPARPAACAAYPFALSETVGAEARQLFVLSDAPCGSGVIEGGPAAREAVRCVEIELLEYVDRVARWNRRQNRRRLAGHRPQSGRCFLEFLLGECAGTKPSTRLP